MKITERDKTRAFELHKRITGTECVLPVEAIAEALARERDEFADQVGATSDEFGMDLEESVSRLGYLLQAQARGEEPNTFGRFAAPDEDDANDDK